MYLKYGINDVVKRWQPCQDGVVKVDYTYFKMNNDTGRISSPQKLRGYTVKIHEIKLHLFSLHYCNNDPHANKHLQKMMTKYPNKNFGHGFIPMNSEKKTDDNDNSSYHKYI